MQRGGEARPIWLTALGLVSVTAIGLGLAYAVWIGLVNFARIGV